VLLGIIMLAVTAFGTLMTLVTVSLDTMAEDLGSSRATMTWTITGLMLTMAVFTPLAGTLGDIWGHRKVLLLGLGGGAIATALCGVAWSAGSLIGFRVLFGMFTAELLEL
jgi:DHA2 family multidrug resistance protein